MLRTDLTKAVVNEANKYPDRKKSCGVLQKNPAMMNNLRGVALEEKVMTFVVNSCKKNNSVPWMSYSNQIFLKMKKN